MFRTCIFLALIALAVAFGALAIITDENFFVGVWPQLFWLTFGVIATTFFVETILRHDEANRRRAEDGFAFRTFAANIFARLLEISAVRTGVDEDLFVAAPSGKREFDRRPNGLDGQSARRDSWTASFTIDLISMSAVAYAISPEITFACFRQANEK
jgi:hypothetical protein